MTGGLLAVHAHPDDETLATGALLATWAASGAPVTLVTATRGERGEVIGEQLAHLEGDGAALAAHRERELAAALEALGVRDHAFLDAGTGERLEDSGMAWVGAGRAGAADDVPARALVSTPVLSGARALARLLRDRRPDVVVTYEPGGGYGHPDHVRVHEVTVRAVELAAREGDHDHPAHAVTAVLWAVQAEDALRRGRAGLALTSGPLDGLVLPDPYGELPSVAVPGADVDLEVAVLPVRDRVLAALRAHATQVQAVTAVDAATHVAAYALSNAVLAPVLPHEQYRVLPGPRGAGTPDALTWPAGVRRVA